MMKEQFRRRRLPHYDKPGAIYFVTSCLNGSIPALGLNQIAKYRQFLAGKAIPQGMTTQQWARHKWKLEFAKSDQWLDQHPAARHLESEALAAEVENTLLHFAGERYAIWAWVVMPSHFHWVFEPLLRWVKGLGDSADDRTPRERIMHSIKRHSARQCNRIRGLRGTFWQDESYDHCVDNVDELQRVIEYVEQNPVKADLVDDASEFRFSSASYRKAKCVPPGRPLLGETQLTAFG